MYRYRDIFVALLLLLIVSIPYIRLWLEESMVGTMFIQYPILVASGFFLAKGFPKRWRNFFTYYNENGIAGIIIVLCVSIFWMLPRAMDAALNDPYMEMAKYLSLSFVVGVPLYYSWNLLGSISKSFIWTNLISKIFVMSWLYIVSPARLCNNYLVSEQQQLGKALFILGIVICIVFIGRVFVGKALFSGNNNNNRQKMNVTSNALNDRIT